MAQLAIRGHATIGREVIELLEMLGGKNTQKWDGKAKDYCYVINSSYNNTIECLGAVSDAYRVFILEEFLEKFPYKVGDKVKCWINGYCSINNIKDIQWDSITNEIKYKIQDYWYSTMNLQPYKEETMEETKPVSPTTEINLNHPCFDAYNEIKLIIPANWKFEQRGKEMFGVRKQYPKTYEECCKVLSLDEDGRLYTKGYKASLIQNFQKLLICRNAYWKIAGEQMGLGKPWEPDYTDDNIKSIIGVHRNHLDFNSTIERNHILIFPTTEMRDAFYENFKELVELVKELL